MKEKKKWVKPELVVLVRRKPEEGILVYCRLRYGGKYSMAVGCAIKGCEQCSG